MAVELAELIEQLRSELTSAMHSGDGADVQFEVGPVELELTIQVEKAATPGAKIRFWVVEAGADVKSGSTTTSRIKLVLDPRRTGKAPGSLKISGDAAEGER